MDHNHYYHQLCNDIAFDVTCLCICVSIQRLYQKDYHQTKTKNHIPSDIIANKVAKRCQDMLSDVMYRTYLHQWTCPPDHLDTIRARKSNEILSDVRTI